MIINRGPEEWMREDTRDREFGKYDCGMAVYLHFAMLDGDDGDDYASSPEGSGDWVIRYGRRLLMGDDRGFVSCQTFATAADAAITFGQMRDDIEPIVCARCGERPPTDDDAEYCQECTDDMARADADAAAYSHRSERP